MILNLGKATTANNLPVTSDSLFPVYTNLYGPDSGREEDSGRYRTLSLTQRFGKDLYLEAAFNDFLGHKWRPWSSGGFQTLMVDPNSFLPNGAANPNFGKDYIDRIQQPQDYHFIDSTVRVGLTYQLDLKKYNRWLGMQRFSTSYDHRKTGRYIDNYVEVNTTPLAAATAAAQTTTQNWATNAQNFIDRRFYLNPAAGVIAAGDINVPINDNGVTGVLERVKAPTVTQNRTNSFSEAMQSFWLKDHLVTTVGFRQDTADAYQGRTGITQDFSGVYLPATKLLDGSAPAATYAVDTKSIGAVLHITENVSVYANKSDNFSPDVTRHNIFGGIIPPTVGKGQDYGFKFQFFDDKLSIDLGRYENSKDNFVISGGLVPDDSGIAAIWTALGVTASDPRYPAQGQQYNYTNSNKSKGTELELTYNPTPNWRIRLAADKNDTIFSTYAPELDAYFNQYIALWSQAQYANLVGNGNTVTTSIQNLKNTMTLTHAQLGLRPAGHSLPGERRHLV